MLSPGGRHGFDVGGPGWLQGSDSSARYPTPETLSPKPEARTLKEELHSDIASSQRAR